MRNVVDRCVATGLSTASYFFSTRDSRLRSERPFVATIVHQLTTLHPDLRTTILDIIRGHPTIFEESLDFQMDMLLVRPLQLPTFRSHLPPSHKIVFAIDGLDECDEERERGHLLAILHSLVNKLPRLIVIVIASRPEFDLRQAFSHPKLSDVTRVVKLQEYDGTKDVWVFLCDEFEIIRQTHFLKKSIPKGWPIENFVQLLVDKSSGNFIVPSTAINYIKESRRNPVDSLNIIVGLLKNLSPDISNPFAELDALYFHILHPPNTDLALMKRILHCLLGIIAPYSFNEGFYQSPAFLDDFLDLPPDTTITVLCDLHSILSVPDSESEGIQFHHKTLEDYLLDPKRSLDLFQSPYDTHVNLTMVGAMHLTRWDANPVAEHSNSLDYVSYHWDVRLLECITHKPTSAALPEIFLNMDPRTILKYRFVHDRSPFDIVSSLPSNLHAALCSKRRCVRLCQLVTRIHDCLARCNAFANTFGSNDPKKRLEALPDFLSETGLYAPLDPDSRTVFNAGEFYGHLQNPSGLDRPVRHIKRWFTGSRWEG